MEAEHFQILISRKLSNEATPVELEELAAWAALNQKNQALIAESERIWNNSKRLFASDEIEKDKAKIINRIQLSDKQKRLRFLLIYRIAAVLAIPALLIIGWYAGSRSSSPSANFACEISAPKGQVAECLLPDSTKIWLNTGSTIRYNPSHWNKSRTVELTGEAYFKVAHNQNNPFVVETSGMHVTVLGTSFNVKAYPGEATTETTLEEGNILLSFTNFPGQAPIQLNPGEHAVYQFYNKKLDIKKTDTYLLTAWRDGKYIFKDADLKTIVQQLEKLYDVHIHLKNEEMGQLRFRGMFEYNKNILDALETIERSTSFKYRMNGRDIWLDNK